MRFSGGNCVACFDFNKDYNLRHTIWVYFSTERFKDSQGFELNVAAKKGPKKGKSGTSRALK